MVEFTEVAERAARAGGQVLLDWIGRFQVREKGPSDLVTEADLASQQAIRQTILASFPKHDVLGEEDQEILNRTSAYRWIVDPLDGTTNYVHRCRTTVCRSGWSTRASSSRRAFSIPFRASASRQLREAEHGSMENEFALAPNSPSPIRWLPAGSLLRSNQSPRDW